MNIYKQELMDHYRNPRNHGVIEKADFASNQSNPSCGDAISFTGMVKDQTLSEVAFTGTGCVISLATASLLAQKVKHYSPDQVMNITPQDIRTLVGLELGPVRLQCALLPLEALQHGIAQYISQNI